jgi:pimeloyl-ACP methyl ester carboxylesterase
MTRGVDSPAEAATGSYVDLDGLRTYYEVHGSGDPVLLLHGGFVTAESWEAQTAALAGQYRVYVPERRGHGRTPDAPGPITYEIMARDTINFIEALDIGPAHLIGWSDGGNVALEVALARPELVRKLVMIGAAIHMSGFGPDLLAFLPQFTIDVLPPTLRETYDRLSPDGPEHFPIVFEKLITLWRSEPQHALTDVAHLEMPTLHLIGDDDDVTVEHAAAVQQAMPNAQLAVVPGTDHGVIFEKPEVVNRLLLDFLADEQVTKIFKAAATG